MRAFYGFWKGLKKDSKGHRGAGEGLCGRLGGPMSQERTDGFMVRRKFSHAVRDIVTDGWKREKKIQALCRLGLKYLNTVYIG